MSLAEKQAPHPALIKGFLLHGQALPEEEDVIRLVQDLQGFRSGQGD